MGGSRHGPCLSAANPFPLQHTNCEFAPGLMGARSPRMCCWLWADLVKDLKGKPSIEATPHPAQGLIMRKTLFCRCSPEATSLARLGGCFRSSKLRGVIIHPQISRVPTAETTALCGGLVLSRACDEGPQAVPRRRRRRKEVIPYVGRKPEYCTSDKRSNSGQSPPRIRGIEVGMDHKPSTCLFQSESVVRIGRRWPRFGHATGSRAGSPPVS